jgi:hypothetical protein
MSSPAAQRFYRFYRYISGSFGALHFTVNCSASCCILGSRMTLALVGQILTQAQHLMQPLLSVTTVSSTVTTSVGQTEAHWPHRMQISAIVSGEMFASVPRSL